jgi:hypothetical protein
VRVLPERKMLELSETASVRHYRLEASYTRARLEACEETARLANDFEEAADKLALLESEESRFDTRCMEVQALVEAADDAWDDTMHAFMRRLLELSNHSQDHELYRKYFTDVPSHATSLSYHAEIMISKDLEHALELEEIEELRSFAERLRAKRDALENLLTERTRHEVETARFHNRVSLAKIILNKLRRIALSSIEEIAIAGGHDHAWCMRFFHARNDHFEALSTYPTSHMGQNGTKEHKSAAPAADHVKSRVEDLESERLA